MVDVVTEAISTRRPVEPESRNKIMHECEKFCNLANPDVKSLEEQEDWEENISR